MTVFAIVPQAGADISAFLAQQDLTAVPDPTTPVDATAAGNFVALGASTVGKYGPMDYVNVPNVDSEAEMDSVFGLGSPSRLQRNVMNVKPSLRFTQKVRGAALLNSAVRNADNTLNYYSMIAGNGVVARQAVGAMCESMDLDFPREGTVTAAMGYQALYAGPSGATPPAMTYGAAPTLPVYYGYNLAFLLNGDDYTDYLRRVRVSVKHTIIRLPPKRKTLSLPGGPTLCLVTSHLKATTQVTGVSLELYQGLPVAPVAQVCRTNPTLQVLATDDCHAGRSLSTTLPDLSFSKDALDEAEATDLLKFSAEADARTFVIVETQAS